VAMGSAADMAIHPAFALLVGAIAGTVSVFGFSLLQGAVETHLHIHDTCGILNLHGIPGVIGAIVAIIASSNSQGHRYNTTQLLEIWHERDERDASKQAKMQLAFLIITLAISIITGLLVGTLLSKLSPPKKCFLDNESWETPAREVPYYFDKRGEARHSSEKPNAPAPQGAASAGAVALEGKQIEELQNKINYLENALRSQRKTLRDQAKAIETITGVPAVARSSTLSELGYSASRPGAANVGSSGGAILTPGFASPRFGNLEPETSAILHSAPLGRSGTQSYSPVQGLTNLNNNNNNNNAQNNQNFQNLATMIESLANKVNLLVDQQKK